MRHGGTRWKKQDEVELRRNEMHCWTGLPGRKLLFSRWFMSNSLQPHGLQNTRLPCLSLSPRVCSNSCPLSWWCQPSCLRPKPSTQRSWQALSKSRMASLLKGVLLVVWHSYSSVFCEHFWETGKMQYSWETWSKQSSNYWLPVGKWPPVSGKKVSPCGLRKCLGFPANGT